MSLFIGFANPPLSLHNYHQKDKQADIDTHTLIHTRLNSLRNEHSTSPGPTKLWDSYTSMHFPFGVLQVPFWVNS